MQFSLIAVSAILAGFVAAQGQSSGSVPACANSCVNNSLPKSCNNDPKCICADTSFITGISCCVSQACSAADQEQALNFARNICNGVGEGANLPSAAGCSGSASPSATAVSTSASPSPTHNPANKLAVGSGAGVAGVILGAAVLL